MSYLYSLIRYLKILFCQKIFRQNFSWKIFMIIFWKLTFFSKFMRYNLGLKSRNNFIKFIMILLIQQSAMGSLRNILQELRGTECEEVSEDLSLTVTKNYAAKHQSCANLKNAEEVQQTIELTQNALKNLVIGEIIGEGSYATVKLVKDSTKNKLYALKILEKEKMNQANQIKHMKNETEILLQLSNPFIAKLYLTWQNSRFVYMLMEYTPGELFDHLKSSGKFSNDTALFYVSQILFALNYLHENDIVYRDLKPQNILIDELGHIKLIDFGFAKLIPSNRTSSICGTPQYFSPEIISCSKYQQGQSCHYGKSVDFWTLGIFIFELLAGYPPFMDTEISRIFEKIMKGIIEFPKFFSPIVKDLIRKLLNPNPVFRLGASDNGISVMKHRWFKSVDWQKLKQKKVLPPWIPDTKSVKKYHFFSKYNPFHEISKQNFRKISDLDFTDF